jgi:hypothetical protein
MTIESEVQFNAVNGVVDMTQPGWCGVLVTFVLKGCTAYQPMAWYSIFDLT